MTDMFPVLTLHVTIQEDRSTKIAHIIQICR